jgi:ankyrin repeat protein
MADDERPPEITPWGDREEPDKLFGGFWWVKAERHGGLYLTAEQRMAIPESLQEHSRDGDGIWWEENSAWSLPVMCLLSGRPESSLTEEEQETLYTANQTCQDDYPHEWEQLTGRKLMPGESRTLDGEIEERHGFDDSGPVDRGARFHALVLAADEDEEARTAGRVHMEVVHAGDEGNEFTKIYAVAPEIARELALVENKPENLAAWLAGKGCKLDCEDGPAVVERRADGEIRETWYRDGHWHRTDGPALVERAADGSTLFEDYFLEGGRVAKEDVLFSDRETFDALVAAAEKGDTAVVNRLLHSGANIHGCEDAPLRTAALHGHGETVRALIEAGAKVDAWVGMALRCMVYRGDTETVTFLLEKGANIFAIVDKVVEDSQRHGRSELADILCHAKAARMGVSQDDIALRIAAGGGDTERVKALLAHGADLHVHQDAALCEAVLHGHTELVKLLLEAGADVHADSDRPIRVAALNGYAETARTLLAGGADVHADDDRPLRVAARSGHTETVKALLEGGADPQARDNQALRWATSRGHVETAEVLRDAGADRNEPSREAVQSETSRVTGKEGAPEAKPEMTPASDKGAEAQRLKSESPANQARRDRPESGAIATELTVHNLLEDPWLVLDHPLPEGADPQLLKAARAAAVVCRYEAEDLIAHDSKDPHAQDLKKIDAVFTDIRHRLGEPEPEGLPLDPEMEKTLNELEKNWKAQPQKQEDRER